MANDDQFYDTLLGKGGHLDQEESMEEAAGNDATDGVAMDDAAAAAAMEKEATPIGNKLCQEIGLDAAVRHRKKGAAKLKAAAELAAAVAAAEEKGYQNGLTAAKQRPANQHPAVQRPTNQRPAFQRPANMTRQFYRVDNGVHKPNRTQWLCNYCGTRNFSFRVTCFNTECQAPQGANPPARNTSNAGCYDGRGNINDNDRNDGNNNNKKKESKIDKMTNLILVLSKID